MKQLTITDLENKNLLAYKYVRGSTLYNLNTPTSDVDYGGVYIAPLDNVFSFPKFFQEWIADEKHDTTYYEVRRWLELLTQSNPNCLESLFVPKDKIIGEVNPLIQIVLDNRDKFLTKQCFKSFYGYAIEQIKRARGLNKKIVKPVYERKTILDFCYTFKNQGSTSLVNWLKKYGLKQEYCGLVNVPNMRDVYGLYYDWGAHKQFLIENESSPEQRLALVKTGNELGAFPDNNQNNWVKWIEISEPIHYAGIMKEGDNESTEVRLSSVEKDVKPLIFITFNKDGYSAHCRDYREYKQWEKDRNPVRYESNLNKNYDSKNICHTVRLIHMALEIAKGEGFNVVRTWDRDFLLDIRNHKYEYDYIIEYLDKIKIQMEEAMKTSTLPEKVDDVFVNDLLIEIRKKQMQMY